MYIFFMFNVGKRKASAQALNLPRLLMDLSIACLIL